MSVKPTLDRKAADQMNLNVLKRMDPDIEELLATAGHVALYDFDIQTQKWSRKDVEGSLFVVKRRSHPRFRFSILNKKSDDSHVEDIIDGFNCEMQAEYILYRSATHPDQGILGIWFYEKTLAPQIFALLQKITSTFAAPSSATIGPPEPQPQQPVAVQQQQQQQQQQVHKHAAQAISSSTRTTVISSSMVGDEDDTETVGGDDFWDRRVKVPDELPAPSPQARSAAPQQQQNTAFANGSGGVGGDSNALARVFAGMKVATSAAAPAPVAVPPPSEPAIALLTPQFLQQQTQQQQTQQQPPAAAGAALLEGLRAASTNLSAFMPPPPQQQQQGGPLSPGMGSSALPPVAPTQAAQGAPPGSVGVGSHHVNKVQSMLHALSGNEAFCGILAMEMRKAGLM